MKAIKVAYSNLRVGMGKCNITSESLSRLLGIYRNSVYNKLNGQSSFSIEEAIQIKNTFFPEYEYSYLFRADARKNVV